MRLRHIALGCALAGTFGLVVLPPATALAKGKAPTDKTAPAAARHAAAKNAPARKSTALPKPRLTVTSPVTDNPYGARVTLTIKLGPTANRTVSLYATPAGQARTLLATGVVNANGQWSPTYTITTATTFTAVFTGDAGHAATWASRTLQVYARVADRLTGAYKTMKLGRVTYQVFHGAGTLTLYSKVWPDKHGECLEPETQQYDAGPGWDMDTRYGCDKLDATSHDIAPFSLNQAVGARYRIRADYFHSPKDGANLNEHAPWIYFIVAK